MKTNTLFFEEDEGIFIKYKTFRNDNNGNVDNYLFKYLGKLISFDFKFKVFDEEEKEFKVIPVHKCFVSARCEVLKGFIDEKKKEIFGIKPSLFKIYIGKIIDAF